MSPATAANHLLFLFSVCLFFPRISFPYSPLLFLAEGFSNFLVLCEVAGHTHYKEAVCVLFALFSEQWVWSISGFLYVIRNQMHWGLILSDGKVLTCTL